jgi:hypothetical protein
MVAGIFAAEPGKLIRGKREASSNLKSVMQIQNPKQKANNIPTPK